MLMMATVSARRNAGAQDKTNARVVARIKVRVDMGETSEIADKCDSKITLT
jgi:hypothetical protein